MMEQQHRPIFVTRSSLPPFEEYLAEIRDIWESRWLTNMGEKHRALEQALAEKLETPHVTLFANGHLALEAALRALRLPAGGQVITTPFTFASTTHAIVRAGLTPVFCDIRLSDYTMDPEQLEGLITEKTVAILPVHVYGNLCDVERIRQIADAHGLKLVYDAAHAFGERLNGTGVAAFGDLSMFSFHATKVFHTIEGGCVCFRDEVYGRLLDGEKNFGLMGGEDRYECPGGNAKMNEFQAAMGLCGLRHLDENTSLRAAVAARYRERLSGVPGIALCAPQPGVESNHAYFPVLFDGFRLDRDGVTAALAAEQVFARKYFYPATNTFACYRDTLDCGHTPNADYAAAHVLTLPLYPDLPLAEVDRICRIITG